MFWFCVWQVVSTLIELIRLGRRSESDKDLEILLLRRLLMAYQRNIIDSCLEQYLALPGIFSIYRQILNTISFAP